MDITNTRRQALPSHISPPAAHSARCFAHHRAPTAAASPAGVTPLGRGHEWVGGWWGAKGRGEAGRAGAEGSRQPPPEWGAKPDRGRRRRGSSVPEAGAGGTDAGRAGVGADRKARRGGRAVGRGVPGRGSSGQRGTAGSGGGGGGAGPGPSQPRPACPGPARPSAAPGGRAAPCSRRGRMRRGHAAGTRQVLRLSSGTALPAPCLPPRPPPPPRPPAARAAGCALPVPARPAARPSGPSARPRLSPSGGRWARVSPCRGAGGAAAPPLPCRLWGERESHPARRSFGRSRTGAAAGAERRRVEQSPRRPWVE